MRILHVNKFLWLSGGVERYMFDVADLFGSRGHEIAFFAMADPDRNVACRESPYFVSNIDYQRMSPWGAARRGGQIVSKTVYSVESKRRIRELIRDQRPDIVHLHLIDHQISPSILHVLRAENIPVVQTIHEYKLICPNYRLYVPRKGEVCERCLGGGYYHCIGQRCMKNSIWASALVTGAMYLHKAMRLYEANVDAFLCSTRFVRAKLEEGGAPTAKLRHVPLYIDLQPFEPADDCGDYIVYVGRLAPEKGVRTLISAVSKVPGCELRIVGDGEDRTTLERHAEKAGARNVEFLGRQTDKALRDVVARARFLVMPSEWYEPCGLVVWEANALGRPAVASRIGGIPESIDEGETGLLFEAGNVDELAEKIASLFEDKARAIEMGRKGRERVEAICSEHYERLMRAYDEALTQH